MLEEYRFEKEEGGAGKLDGGREVIDFDSNDQ